jgi:hypothetical protein
VNSSTWSVIATWFPIAISVISLVFTVWFSVIRPSRQAKTANPTAQLDLLSYESKSGWNEEVRVVITNGGPATMEDVTVEVFDGDDENLAVEVPDVKDLWPKMPVSFLHVGQSLPLTLSLSYGSRDPRMAEVRWRDGRDDEQSRRFVLSYNRVAEPV